MKTHLQTLILLAILFVAGCGGSNSFNEISGSPNAGPVPGGGGSNPPVPTGKVVIESVLEKAIRAQVVPGEAENLRFAGFTEANVQVYGPVVRAKAPLIELDDVPVTVTSVRVEYLAQNDQVIGIASAPVTVVENQVARVPEAAFVEVPIVLQSLSLSPSTQTLLAGDSVQYVATGTLTDGTSYDVSALVSWSSSAPTVASIGPRGLLTGIAAGTVVVTASKEGISATSNVTVTPPALWSYDISQTEAVLAVGQTQSLTAIGVYSDGSRQPLTSGVAWSSSSPAIASVSASGLVTAVGPGTAIISYTSNGSGAQAQITVTAPNATLASLSLNPSVATLAVGQGLGFTAIGSYTDGTQADVTSLVNWTSSSPSVATVDSSGYAFGVAPGTTNISASLSNRSITAPLTVATAAPTLQGLRVAPMPVLLEVGQSASVQAIGLYSDNSEAPITTGVTFSSADPTIATVDSTGLVTGVALGQVNITAEVAGYGFAFTEVLVRPELESLTISPTSVSLAQGLTQQFTVTGHYEDDSSSDLTAVANWSVADPNLAGVNSGLVTAYEVGTTTIIAEISGLEVSADLTVTEATLTGLTVSNADSMPALGQRQLQVFAGYSNGGSVELDPSTVSYVSLDPNVVEVDASGVVSALDGVGGQTGRVEVTYLGVTAEYTIAVTVPVPVALIMTTDVYGSSGDTYDFQVRVQYDNEQQVDVSDLCSYTSSDLNVFVVTNIPDANPGLLTFTGYGEATLTVSYLGLQATTTIHIPEPE